MDYLHFSLSFWIVLQTAKSQTDVGEINCKQNVSSIHCPWNDTCSGTCMFTCTDIERKEDDPLRQIWGTKTYTYFSSVCKAAAHDLRISTWDRTKLSFILQRVPYDSKYWASVRSGIRSYSYLNQPSPGNGSFIFVSPKVKEQILDVGSIHEAFLFDQAGNHVQACLASNNEVSFAFKIFVRETPLSPASTNERWGNLTVYAFRWFGLNGATQAGGFQCFPEKSTLSVVTSIAMSANADFYPAQITYVANVNDNVTLVMKEHSERSSPCASKWKKDDEDLPEFVTQTPEQPTALFLPHVEEGSQGIYSLECTSDSTGRGLLRLIVRACPADTYGDNCTERCPECKNGGVCHDITGVCICSPGFGGTTCENACPPGYFGQSCNMTCPLKQTSQGPKPSCKGYLICLPDPYGCSCASGYKGISCRESYPVLTDDILLKESTSNAITITFRPWISNLDIGNGTPSTYKVYYKRNNDEETWVSKDVIATPISEKERYEVTLQNLAADTVYAVRVVILDVSGNRQEEGVKEYLFSTSCGLPTEPPLIVNIEANVRDVSVYWKLPSQKLWNCRTVSSVVKYRSRNFFEKKSTNETSYSFTSKPYTKWEVTICYGQVNGDNVICAETKIVTTKEDAPGIVRDFKYTMVKSRSINLTWKTPLEANGIIRYFFLRYSQTKWKHSCKDGIDKNIQILRIPRLDVTIQNLNPSATYNFQVAAVTVKEGPINNLVTDTESDVPSAGPTKLEFDESGIFLSWETPPCAKSNGEITKYHITVQGLTSEDNYRRDSTTTAKLFKLRVLPSAVYSAKVFAATEAGFGEKYAEINFQTMETAPAAPTSVSVIERTENSIRVLWTQPSFSYYNVEGYRVSLVLLKSSFAETHGDITDYQRSQTSTTNVLTFTFKNLRPSTTYILSIEPMYGKIGQSTPAPRLSKIVNTRIPIPDVFQIPTFLSSTEDSITVKIFPVKPQDGRVRYFVVVKLMEPKTDEENEDHYRRHEESFFSPSDCNVHFYGNEYVAARLESLPPEGRKFIVGDGRCVDGYSNKLLSPGTYQVGIAVVCEYLDDKRYSEVKYMERRIYVGKKTKPPVDVYTIVLGVLIGFILIVCVLISIFSMPAGFFMKARQRANQTFAMLPWRKRRRPPTPLAFVNTLSDDDIDDDSADTEPEEDISHIISVKDLENYITEGLSNSVLKNQFKALPRGHKYSCRVARHPENRPKNRYGNLLPYDHSRVSLKSTPDDKLSEYINANYVCGYKIDKRYIATQGPLPKTVTDFWRMVWKENSCKIFMVTNLVEQGRMKCDKYWPDETALFGSITVTFKNSEPFPDFVIRTFEISVRKQKRELKQYHYLTWPDHGTPSCTSPVIRFLKKARDYQPNNEGPIIVHCSAGVGRTGTVILLDCMLEMGLAEGKIDVCGHLCQMRKKRTSLLENLEQYVFVYKALQQALCWGETSVPCADLVPQIGNLRKPDEYSRFTPLELQYKRLGKICPSLDNVSVRTSRLPENAPKNRSMEILPPERARPILKAATGEGTTYINAVYVNGYKEKDVFLVTQYPLPNTIGDFWQMIYEKKSRTILLLQEIDFTDPTCPPYWPSEGETVLHGEYRIQCISVKTFGDMRIWNLNLNLLHSKDSSNDSPVPVKLFQQLRWPVGQPLIEYPKSLLDLIDKVEKTQREGKHVVTVQCLNGSTACGVFCATMYVCSKMINEQEVDIFEAVQNVRLSRPHFIESFEQYDFLYDMAITFLDNFGAYANFH